MKRSAILFIAVALAAVLFAGLSGNLKAGKSDTCCQKFQVICAEQVLTGCVISVINPDVVLQCTPDKEGKCTICNIPKDQTFTAEVRCDGGKYGSTIFTACTDDYVIIYVP